MNPFELISNAGRAKEIATVLIRNGFADLLQRLEAPAGWFKRFVPTPAVHLNNYERIRKVLEELGPTFVKFGQMLSMRPDALPEPLILELRKLQDRVAVQSREVMEPVLLSGLPRPPEEIFAEFEETPVASASLAQVYFARLRDGGQPVAVKVQRPSIRGTIEADFELLVWFAAQAHRRVSELRPYNLPGIVEELREGLDRELDFRNEARNAAFFIYQNPSPEKVYAPRPYEELTSRTVLVMERVTGAKLDSVERGSEAAVSLAQTGAGSIFHQILVSGFFHADPHGGNIVVTHDGRICFLDWGLVGQLTRRMRYTLVDLFGAFLQGDSAQVVRIALDLGRASRSSKDMRHMEREILFALRETLNPATGKGHIGRALLRLLHIFGSYDIEIGQDYALVAKAVLAIEEAGTALDPNFNLQASFKPAVDELLKERRDPMEVWRSVRQSLFAGLGKLQDLPSELHRVLRAFAEGNATINFQHRGLEDLDDAINDASNKITVGVIIASLVVGSSLILTTNVKPLLFGFPAIGILGYLLSALLGVWVVFDILRRNRRR